MKKKVMIKKRVSLSEDEVISLWRAASDRKSLPDYGGDKDTEEIFLHMFNGAMYKTDSAWQIVEEDGECNWLRRAIIIVLLIPVMLLLFLVGRLT